MKQRSATLEGFRAILRVPSLGLAEITWRWSFAIAVGAFLIFAGLQFLDTLPVTGGDLALLRTRQPALIGRAALHIFHGSAPRAIAAAIVIALCVAVAWIFVGSLGRTATIRALVDYSRVGRSFRTVAPRSPDWQFSSMIGLNFCRVAATLATLVAYAVALLVGGATGTGLSPGIAALAFFMAIAFITLIWSLLNWFLSFAAVFAIGGGHDTFGALASAVDTFSSRRGPVLAVNTWFGLAHIGAFFVFSLLALPPIALMRVLPARAALFAVLCVLLMYFAVVDFLRVGRFASYLYIAFGSETAPPLPRPGPVSPTESAQDGRVDQDEPILSDLSAVPSEN